MWPFRKPQKIKREDRFYVKKVKPCPSLSDWDAEIISKRYGPVISVTAFNGFDAVKTAGKICRMLNQGR